MEWSIRSLLNPVITRLLIYGVNPVDVEAVLKAVENKNHLNAHSLEKCWLAEWQSKAEFYQSLGEKAAKNNNKLSAREFFFFAAQCYYAIFLINFQDINDKKRMYQKYAALYRTSLSHYPTITEYIEIPINDKQRISGLLHHPEQKSNEPYPCVIIYSGLGSCKEEMHTLARPLVDRGIAVFTPDMPGNGETLFVHDVKCRMVNLKAAFSNVINILAKDQRIKPDSFATYGLCMGGGFAYYAAAQDTRYKACVNLFPLLISHVTPGTTPQWMKQGKWYDFQTGGIPSDDFTQELTELEDGQLSCAYLLIHGQHDNWMTLEKSDVFFDKAAGKKEKIIIMNEPVFSNENIVTHAMPVGEQMHWVRYAAADWIKEQL